MARRSQLLPMLWPISLLCACACASAKDVPLADAAQALEDADMAEPDAAEPEPCDEEPPRLAHNIIVIMGDGTGPEQLSTARYAKDGPLRLDELEGPALANTDSLTTLEASEPDTYPTDSAAGASAIATGQRVHNYVLSLDLEGHPLETVLEACQREGKATGLVTTSFFYDASPAAFASHQPERGRYEAIIREMLMQTQPDVIMGSVTREFDDPALGLHQVSDEAGYTMVRGAPALLAWDPVQQPRLLGLFETDFMPLVEAEPFTMTPALERRPDSPDPALTTMTARALERLASDEDGFFLFVEDEILDEMGHRGPAEVAWANRAYPAQAAALDDVVGVAIDWVHEHSSFSETLIVLLADHETGGYHYDPALGPSSGSFSAVVEGPAGVHTRTPTAVYARGPGSEALSLVHEHADTHALLIGTLHARDRASDCRRASASP